MKKILIVFALYVEAKRVVDAFGLKRRRDGGSFQVFESDRYILIITGTGKISAACAVTSIFSRDSEIIACVNFGIVGSGEQDLGGMFLIDQILDDDSGRSFYPDIFFQSKIARATLTTCSKPLTNKQLLQTDLVDMEASGVFEAASHFLATDRIIILKIVSDNCDSGVLDKERVLSLLSEKALIIQEFIDQIFSFLVPSDDCEIEVYCRNDVDFSGFHFTKTTEIEITKLLNDLAIQSGRDSQKIVQEISSRISEEKNKKDRAKLLTLYLKEELKKYSF